jgi:hypothetical protein
MKPVRILHILQGETPNWTRPSPEDPAHVSRGDRELAGSSRPLSCARAVPPRIANLGMIDEDLAMPGLTSTVCLA